jgi:hypothetical protein
MVKKQKTPEKKIPSFDVTQLPSPKDPQWREEGNRFLIEETLRLFLFSAMDKLDTSEISTPERRLWNKAVVSFSKLADHYSSKGYEIHIH